jgi:hypothetical protein
MIDLEDRLASLTTVAERFVEPIETVLSRAHRRIVRRRAWRGALAAVLATAGIGATIVMTRSHPRTSVSVQPSTGTISRGDAIKAMRTAAGPIAKASVAAKLITFDDYEYAVNNGAAPTTPVILQPPETPITRTTPIWLIYVQGANTIALGHGPPDAWALVFVNGYTGRIAYRMSDTNPAWPYWTMLPDRAGPGDRTAFCAVAHKTLGDNANVPSMTSQQELARTSLQIEQLLVVASPKPRNDLTAMRTYVKAEINKTPPPITYRDEAAANGDFDNSVRDECHIDLGTESILGVNSHATSASGIP